jgi:hypothetical protein
MILALQSLIYPRKMTGFLRIRKDGITTHFSKFCIMNLRFIVLKYSFTISFTQTGGAQAQFAFNGDAVAIYGSVSPFLADYAVTTDGVTQGFQSSSQGLASTVHMNVSTLGCPCTVH